MKAANSYNRKKRTQIGSRVDRDLWLKFKKHADVTKRNYGNALDIAIQFYLDRYESGKEVDFIAK